MTKETWVIILGVVVALTPFLGFPGSWKMFMYVLAGLVISSLALLLQLRKVSENRNSISKNGKQTDVYMENGMRTLTENPTRNGQKETKSAIQG